MQPREPRSSHATRQALAQSRIRLAYLWATYKQSGLFDLNEEKLARLCVKLLLKRRSVPASDHRLYFSLALHLLSFANLKLVPPHEQITATWQRIQAEHAARHMEALAERPKAAVKDVTKTIVHILIAVADAQATTGEADVLDLVLYVARRDTLQDPSRMIRRIQEQVLHPKEAFPELFAGLRQRLEINLKRIAHLRPGDDWGGKKRPRPEDDKLGTPVARVGMFLAGFGLENFLGGQTRLTIPNRARLEHMHLLAPTGWGKTQTLEYLINQDIRAVRAGKRSLLIMESEGGLTRRIARHPAFDPKQPGNIADKLYMLDPGLPGHMPTLSFFDLANASFADMPREERERISNHIVDLYRYIFRALRGAELTEKQGYVFVQLVQMLVWVKGATFEILVDCLDDPDLAVELSLQAPERLQRFFATKYKARNFAGTREEIFQRLDTFRSSAETFVRMVSGQKSNFDLLQTLNRGSVVVINTSKDMLSEGGSEIFGRFMIALLRMASLSRSESDIPCYAYIDEAQEYLDEKSAALFQQARKRAIGLVIAHQDLQQLSPELKSTILTNTNLKICGNGDYSDRVTMARNMRTAPEILARLEKKDRSGAQFAVFARDLTKDGAVTAQIPYGTLDKLGLQGELPKGRWPIKEETPNTAKPKDIPKDPWHRPEDEEEA